MIPRRPAAEVAVHRSAAPVPSGRVAASASLSGTLAVIVTAIAPVR